MSGEAPAVQVQPQPRRRRWRPDRRRLSVAAATILAAVALAAGALAPVPYVILSPGPVVNTLGAVQGTPVVEITGTTTYPTDGELDMTTVRERGGPYGPLTASEAVWAYFNKSSAVVPESLLFPPGQNDEKAKQQSAADFDEAQTNAKAAALNYLGIPATTRVLVDSVLPEGPAAGVLMAGDVLTAIGAQPVSTADEAVAAIRAVPPGTPLDFQYLRSDQPAGASITTAPRPGDPTVSYVGATLRTDYQAPFGVDFAVKGIGGPSAGLVFTLTIIDQLTDGKLMSGRHVAGTGTINPAGEVGKIGGIQQKMIAAHRAGAVLFLAPRGNCPQVVGNIPEGLQVAAVGTVTEAVQALQDSAAGRPVAGCPTD